MITFSIIWSSIFDKDHFVIVTSDNINVVTKSFFELSYNSIDAVRDFGNGLADIKPKFEKFQDEAGKAIAKIKSYESSLRETLGSDKTPHGVSINEVTGMIKRYINATNKVIKLYGDSCSACKAFADEMIDAHDQTLGDKAKAKQDKIDAKKAKTDGAAA